MIILGENFKWHLEAFASELFNSSCVSNWWSLVSWCRQCYKLFINL